MNVGQAIEHLKIYKRDLPCAFVIWTPADVETITEELGVKLTAEEIEEVLRRMGKRHDATIGINWDVIRSLVREVFAARVVK